LHFVIEDRSPTKEQYSMTISMIAAALVLAAAFAGRAEAQAVGSYKLVQVGDDALPAVVAQEEGCRQEISWATLTLGQNGKWTLSTRGRKVCGRQTETEVDSDGGRYTVSGQTLRFSEDDGDRGEADGDDALDDFMEGSLNGDTLRIRTSDRYLVFRRNGG
jgi:hypothetical protein